MTRPTITEHNTETDEVIDREMNDAEFAQYEVDQLAQVATVKAEADKAKARAALLAKLGITADEAELLLS